MMNILLKIDTKTLLLYHLPSHQLKALMPLAGLFSRHLPFAA